MDEVKKTEVNQDAVGETRRSIVKTAAQVAVTAPAVSLLLATTVKPASATLTQYQATQQHVLDDYTYGNDEEDIDGKKGFFPSQDDAFGNAVP